MFVALSWKFDPPVANVMKGPGKVTAPVPSLRL
jgi:hypothetical protein